MNHLAIALSLVLLSFIGFGIFVYFFTPRTKLIKVWCIFFSLASLWALGLLIMLISSSKALALLSCRIANLAALFIPVLYIHFVLLLTEQYQKKKRILFWHYVFTFIYSLSALIFPWSFIPDVSPKMTFDYYTTAGVIYYLFPFSFLWMVYYALQLLYQCYRQADDVKRNQLKYVFVGTGIAFVGGGTTFFLVFDIPVYPWGAYLVPVYVLTVSYAILKHHLMDINIVVRKGLVYSILVTCVTAFYLLVIFISEKFLQGLVGYNSNVISCLTALAMAFTFTPFKNFIQQFVDKIFLKGNPLELAEQNQQMRRELIQTEKYKSLGVFSSGVAHEIKNPLTAIKTFSEYLPEKMEDKEFLAKFARIVGKEVERVNQLVHSLLDYGKPLPTKLEDVDIHHLIQETLDILSSRLISQKVKLVTHFANESGDMYQPLGTCPRNSPLRICVDSHQIRQILLNLFINAIEAMPQGGNLFVSTAESKNEFILTVKDTGCGISKENLKKIASPFFTTKQTGTGLGLCVTQSIIESLKGKLEIDSKVGVGTEIRVRLPLTVPSTPLPMGEKEFLKNQVT